MNRRILPPAQEELRSAIDWYDRKRTGLGTELSEEAQNAIARILHDPTSWEVVTRDIRRCPVQRFPYDVLFYAAPDEVVIVAFRHYSRRSNYWISRLKDLP